MSDTLPKPPTGLQARGRQFWSSTVAAYELTDSETALLHETCRTMDNLDSLAHAITTDGTMTTGSAGQPVMHPALTEARGQRAILHRLLAALALPDDDGKTITTATTTRAKTAAAARWTSPTTLKAVQ